MERSKALRILEEQGFVIEVNGNVIYGKNDIAEVIAELKEPKHCKTCKQYSPWECTDGSVLDVGSCRYGIRFGRESINEQYRSYVKEDFGCTEYTQKDPE